MNAASTPPAPKNDLLAMASDFARAPGEAVWRQIARMIEKRIEDGSLPTGTRLPTEHELAERFGVNRHTLRRSLRELTRKGLINATPRRGTFVSRERITFPLGTDKTLTEIVADSGCGSAYNSVSSSSGIAPPEIANLLSVSERTRVVELKFVHQAGDLPLALTSSWLVADRFAKIGETFQQSEDIWDAVGKMGVESVKRKETRITSHPTTEDEARFLGISKSTTILAIRSVYVDQEGAPFMVKHLRFPADRIELVEGSA